MSNIVEEAFHKLNEMRIAKDPAEKYKNRHSLAMEIPDLYSQVMGVLGTVRLDDFIEGEDLGIDGKYSTNDVVPYNDINHKIPAGKEGIEILDPDQSWGEEIARKFDLETFQDMKTGHLVIIVPISSPLRADLLAPYAQRLYFETVKHERDAEAKSMAVKLEKFYKQKKLKILNELIELKADLNAELTDLRRTLAKQLANKEIKYSEKAQQIHELEDLQAADMAEAFRRAEKEFKKFKEYCIDQMESIDDGYNWDLKNSKMPDKNYLMLPPYPIKSLQDLDKQIAKMRDAQNYLAATEESEMYKQNKEKEVNTESYRDRRIPNLYSYIKESIDTSMPVHPLSAEEIKEFLRNLSKPSNTQPPEFFNVGYIKELNYEIPSKFRGGRGSADMPRVRIFKCSEMQVYTGIPYEHLGATRAIRAAGHERTGDRTGFNFGGEDNEFMDMIGYNQQGEEILQCYIRKTSHPFVKYFISINDSDLAEATFEDLQTYLTPASFAKVGQARDESQGQPVVRLKLSKIYTIGNRGVSLRRR